VESEHNKRAQAIQKALNGFRERMKAQPYGAKVVLDYKDAEMLLGLIEDQIDAICYDISCPRCLRQMQDAVENLPK